KGIDMNALATHAHANGKLPQLEDLQGELRSLEYSVPFGLMNLQDAVDFAAFAIRTTIDVQRLTHGTFGLPGSFPGVGGPIEIAAVTAIDGFRWVQRTDLQGERPAGEAEQL